MQQALHLRFGLRASATIPYAAIAAVEPREGVWETRKGRKHFTHSRLMCWVALDRLLEMHRRGQISRIPTNKFTESRQELRADVPELRVTEGDTVRVTVTNELSEPTTIHWHGVEVPNAMDGVPKLSQEPIPPGGSFTYEFVATPAGTRWYHAHFNELTQQGGGLVGALIVEPREPVSPAPDREYVVVTQEWVTAAAPTQQPATPTPTSGSPGGMMGPGGMMRPGGSGGMAG